jgi:hypothetical protein
VIVRAPNARAAGWALAGVAATALLGGAVMALAAERQAPVLVLDLGALPRPRQLSPPWRRPRRRWWPPRP